MAERDDPRLTCRYDSSMADVKLPHRKYVLLLMYDMASEEHAGIRDFFKGYHDGHWVSVQRSIRLILSLSTPEQLRNDLKHYAHGDVFIVDVTSAAYTGFGNKKVWDWLAAARAECAAIQSRINRAAGAEARGKLGEKMKELYGAESPAYLKWKHEQTEIDSLNGLLDES